MYKGLILKSHTMDFNVLLAVGVVVEQNLSMFQGMLPANSYTWIVAGVAIANVLLRLKTKGPVNTK